MVSQKRSESLFWQGYAPKGAGKKVIKSLSEEINKELRHIAQLVRYKGQLPFAAKGTKSKVIELIEKIRTLSNKRTGIPMQTKGMTKTEIRDAQKSGKLIPDYHQLRVYWYDLTKEEFQTTLFHLNKHKARLDKVSWAIADFMEDSLQRVSRVLDNKTEQEKIVAKAVDAEYEEIRKKAEKQGTDFFAMNIAKDGDVSYGDFITSERDTPYYNTKSLASLSPHLDEEIAGFRSEVFSPLKERELPKDITKEVKAHKIERELLEERGGEVYF